MIKTLPSTSSEFFFNMNMYSIKLLKPSHLEKSASNYVPFITKYQNLEWDRE